MNEVSIAYSKEIQKLTELKNLLLSKMLFFENMDQRRKPPNPPASSILMPSKKYDLLRFLALRTSGIATISSYWVTFKRVR